NALAVDIGGSSLKIGIFAGDHLIYENESDNDGKKGADHLIHHLIAIIEEAKSSYRIPSVGLSVSGQIDARNGKVLFGTEAVPGFTGTPLRQIVEEACRLPIYMENDANCAALGEAVYGAGKEYDSFLCLTYGTGVGGGIIMNRRIWNGQNGCAGELGHMVLHAGGTPCVCGRSGCYEAYASTTALISRVFLRTGMKMNGREIFQKFEQPEVREEIDLWIDEITEGLISLLHIFNPAAVLLGGGIMQQDYVFEEVKYRTLSRALPTFRETRILRAALGNRAGIYGAHLLERA
ncbi:MAG: ROK family protein, partial [Clostridiales bacterium]|nr:ROK family protein [Clostridiales bacterium]